MSKRPCPRCGAPGSDFICAYCGASLRLPGDEHAELAALDQYHSLIDEAKSNTDQCVRLISNGFVPSGHKALVEAGLRCLARIDIDQPLGNCNAQWVKRLEAISTRLKVLSGEDALHAVAEFDAKAKAWREADARETKHALLFFAILGAGLIAIVWWLIRLIWPA